MIITPETPMVKKVYVLIDPVTFEIRYVGATWLPLKTRLIGHMGNKSQVEKCEWINGLKKQGLKPIIDLVEYSDWVNVTESFWIVYYRSFGHNIFNKMQLKDKIEFENRKTCLYE